MAKSSENNYYISHYTSETTKLSEIGNDEANNMLVGMSNVEECGWLINTVASLEEEQEEEGDRQCEVEPSGSGNGNSGGKGYTGSEEGKDGGIDCAGSSSKGERRRGSGRQESALQQSLMNCGANGGDTVFSSATASTNGGTTSRDGSADGNLSAGSGFSSGWQSPRRKGTSPTDHSGSSSGNDRDSTCSGNSRSGSVGEATSVEGSEGCSVAAQNHRLCPSNKGNGNSSSNSKHQQTATHCSSVSVSSPSSRRDQRE